MTSDLLCSYAPGLFLFCFYLSVALLIHIHMVRRHLYEQIHPWCLYSQNSNEMVNDITEFGTYSK